MTMALDWFLAGSVGCGITAVVLFGCCFITEVKTRKPLYFFGACGALVAGCLSFKTAAEISASC